MKKEDGEELSGCWSTSVNGGTAQGERDVSPQKKKREERKVERPRES